MQGYSTEDMKVQLYPITKYLNRCALSIFLHSQHFVPTERLASVIALCNQDTLRGEFTILNIKSLKTNKRVGARVLALDGSPEFLESLSKTKKDHKFRLSNKRFYISGGTRLDSKSTPSSFPSLTSEQSTSILTRNLDKILANAKRQQSENASRRPIWTKILFFYCDSCLMRYSTTLPSYAAYFTYYLASRSTLYTPKNAT